MAVVLPGTPDNRTLVNHRQVDDLPTHIKGTATFENYRGLGSQKRYKTGYYITTKDGKKRPVKFIRINNQDAWYSLEKNDLGRYVTTTAKKCPEHLQKKYLGNWNITDPQHPEYVHEPAALEETSPITTENPYAVLASPAASSRRSLATSVEHLRAPSPVQRYAYTS